MDKELIQKWLDGSLSEKERNEFEKSEDFKKIRHILHSAKSFKAPEFDIEAELVRLSNQKKSTPVIKVNWLRPALQTAAAILFLAVAWLFFTQEKEITYQTAAGEKLELYLPDSSSVILNANSKIHFTASNWNEDRNISLDGEAYFRVNKGSTFTVATQEGLVTVLGTQFNVKKRRNYYEVICYEGEVSVAVANTEVRLIKDESFRIIDEIQKEEKHNLQAPSWISHESHFSSVPYFEVLEELKRQYGISLTLRDIPTNQLFSGSFTHQNLDLALKAITLPMNIRYDKVDDQTIILTGDLD